MFMVCRVRWTHAVMHESWFASLEKSTFYIEEHTARERGRRRREPGVIRELYSVALIFFFGGSAWRLFDRERDKTCWGPRP